MIKFDYVLGIFNIININIIFNMNDLILIVNFGFIKQDLLKFIYIFFEYL